MANDVKGILESVTLFQKGVAVDAAKAGELRDNFAVLVTAGSALAQMPPDSVLKPLRAAHPHAVFTLVTKRPSAPAKPAAKPDGK